ncbi:MAG TPA: hypothetical protein VFJ76_07830 [Solirubrobacterales bacterium]|nr:hypothetical protein [Solirubrobacterales bacterium]
MELAIEPIKTLGDLVRTLRYKDVCEDGLEERHFTDNGLLIEPAAVALRSRGYKVEVFHDGETRRLRLLETPDVGAKRRKEAQTRLV